MSATGTQAADALAVLPAEFTLTGPQSSQRLLVENVRDGLIVGQVTEGVTFTSSDESIVRIEDGVALPVGNGTATITATAGESTAAATVIVERQDAPFVWSFRNHVQSVLSKAGCNSGACHGAAAGKNGFKLSLRGYDPEADYWMITRQSRGRRIVPGDPGRSLLLTKPSGAVPHKGGLRFEPGSVDYRVIAEWIAAGHPGPSEEDARIDHLEILPAGAVLTPG
ncbi:MAG: Ig-like domain-containing protein, partial [Planctomycetaceae bacterium]